MNITKPLIAELSTGSVEVFIGDKHFCGELKALEISDQSLLLRFDWVAKSLRSVWIKAPIFDLDIDLTKTFAAAFGDGLEFSCPSQRTVIRMLPRGAAQLRKEDIRESLYSIARENIQSVTERVIVPAAGEIAAPETPLSRRH